MYKEIEARAGRSGLDVAAMAIVIVIYIVSDWSTINA
jgi:hypothetical protein